MPALRKIKRNKPSEELESSTVVLEAPCSNPIELSHGLCVAQERIDRSLPAYEAGVGSIPLCQW